MNPAIAEAPRLLSFQIYDPLTGLNAFLDPATHLARHVPRSGPLVNAATKRDTGGPACGSRVIEEDLGTQSLEDVSVHGTRKSTTVPAVARGTGKQFLRSLAEPANRWW